MKALSSLDALRAAYVVLASASPRRRQLLSDILTLDPRVHVSDFEENLDKSQHTPASYVMRTAMGKAADVYGRLAAETPPQLVIGADTVVHLDGQILEKPADADDAVRMLTALSGRAHEVLTGVALLYRSEGGAEPEEKLFVERTIVHFAEVPREAIEAYVRTGEPMDKAGSYGIQGLAGAFVEKIDGSYDNVVGFPLHRFCAELDVDKVLCR